MGKESSCNAEDPGSIPGLGRSPGKGNGNALGILSWRSPMGREAWWATVHGVTKSWAQLSDSHIHFNLATSPSAMLYQTQALDRAQSLSSMY